MELGCCEIVGLVDGEALGPVEILGVKLGSPEGDDDGALLGILLGATLG